VIAQESAPAPESQTRNRILRTAFQLFHEQGFHATGVATIVREAQINPGSLYHFFDSKEQLLLRVLEFALWYLGPAVMEPVERKTGDPIERVFALLAQYRDGMVARGCRMGCPIGNLALEVSDNNAEARRLIHENFANWARRVESWLAAAAERLPGDLDRARLARFILTVMEGGLMQARAANSLRPFDEAVAVLRTHIDLLLARGARRARPARKRARRARRG
jgi:TetR/AcrR family transcriptional regulator, transcriptional repressor for nem operon